MWYGQPYEGQIHEIANIQLALSTVVKLTMATMVLYSVKHNDV